MINSVVLVGRLVRDPELRTTNDGKKVTNITLAVKRSYSSPETGKPETDFINFSLWEAVASAIVSHCKKGSTIGIEGRIISKKIELENNKKLSYPEIVADKVTFINTINKELGETKEEE